MRRIARIVPLLGVLLFSPSWVSGTGGIFLAAEAAESVKPSGMTVDRVAAGEIASISGEVSISVGAKQNLSRGGKVGDVVYIGDTISTAVSGQIKLLMKDQSILDLGPSSAFTVADFSNPHDANRTVALTLDHGQMRGAITRKLKATSKFVIRTKTATMGVRGTELVVKTGTSTEVTVIQGRVEVQPTALALAPGAVTPKPVFLTAGNQLVIDAASQSRNLSSSHSSLPVSLDESKLTAVRQSIKLTDAVLTKAIVDDHKFATSAAQLDRAPATNAPSLQQANAAEIGLAGTQGASAPLINPRAGTAPKITFNILPPTGH